MLANALTGLSSMEATCWKAIRVSVLLNDIFIGLNDRLDTPDQQPKPLVQYAGISELDPHALGRRFQPAERLSPPPLDVGCSVHGFSSGRVV